MPAAVAFVAGQDDGLAGLVASADDLEEKGGVDGFQGQIADFVQQQQVGTGQGVADDVEAIALAGGPRALDQIVQGDEVDPVSRLDGGQAQADGQVGSCRRRAVPGRGCSPPGAGSVGLPARRSAAWICPSGWTRRSGRRSRSPPVAGGERCPTTADGSTRDARSAVGARG